MRLILAEEPTVQFSEIAQLFIAGFGRPSFHAEEAVNLRGGGADKTLGESSGKTENQVLLFLSERPGMTIPELAEALKITTRGIEKQIAKLRSEGRLRRVGPAKGGHWEVVT